MSSKLYGRGALVEKRSILLIDMAMGRLSKTDSPLLSEGVSGDSCPPGPRIPRIIQFVVMTDGIPQFPGMSVPTVMYRHVMDAIPSSPIKVPTHVRVAMVI